MTLGLSHNLRIDAGRDASVIGSVATAENDLGIFAERDVNLVPGRESDQSEYIKKKICKHPPFSAELSWSLPYS